MRKLALGFAAAGGLLIIDSCTLLVRYRMLRNRPSGRVRSIAEGFRRAMRPMFWVGLFIGLLGLVLFLLSLV
jgi:hypothetical protein